MNNHLKPILLISILACTALASHAIDEATFSNFNEIQTQHFVLDIDINFSRKVFSGTQTLHMKSLNKDLAEVYLDINDLTIYSIEDEEANNFEYKIDSPNPILGQRLTILIPSDQRGKENYIFVISYKTSPTAEAISWLTPEQTSGKKLPYMFTQSESIHARSLAPFQDTPSIKSTYVVNTTTDVEFVTRVSGNITYDYTDCMSRYSTFEMNIPVQSYLLAIASGNLVERRIGNRTFVISEPEEIEKVANEFSELEDFLSEAERLTIPYEWGVYKLLILPPSFPFGGMENPLLTFASPAIVPGDKSSVDVAIHEIAHSWFGNLVTNNNWTNFWLNEGFTTFLERKTVRNIFGEDFMKVTAKLENQTVYFEILDYGLDNGFTSLHPVFNGTHPDEALSDIPYEKGFQFLIYLESLIGEDYMLEFLRSYLKNFAYTSIDVTNFISFFSEYVHQKFTTTDAEEILSKIDFDAWIYAPGLPPITVDFETKEYNDAIELAQSFLDAKANATSALQIFKSFSVNLKGLFISHLIDNQEIVDDCMAQYIYDTLQLGDEINGEVVFRWLIVAIRSGQLRAPFESADEFVGSIGRMKYVIPVYQAMLDSNAAIAKAIFNKHEDFYHPIAIKAIQDIFSEDVLISA